MARDTLTQTEIDSLISALSSGKFEEKEAVPKPEYRSYDFRRPTKFSKEQMKTLQIIHDNYARLMGNFLSAFLRVPVRLEVASVSQVTYEEFIFSLTVPTMMTVFNMSPDMGVAMLETDFSFVMILIDLIFGGDGKAPVEVREFTEIEISVMRQINEKFLDNLSYAWKGIAQLSFQIETVDTNPQFNQVIASNETVALVTIAARVQEVEGLINLCYPFISLDRVLPQMTAQHWFNQFQQVIRKTRENEMYKFLYPVEVNVRVVLGSTKIPLEDFLQVQVGDIIELNRKIGEPLEVLVEDQPVFKAQPGLKGNQLGVQIIDWINEEM